MFLKDRRLIFLGVLFSLLFIGKFYSWVFTEENSTEKDRIVANLKGENTRATEIERIKETRRNQINALVQVIADYQKEVEKNIEKKVSPWGKTVCAIVPSVDLLGEMRAIEAIDYLVGFMRFEIYVYDWNTSGGLQEALWIVNVVSSGSTALAKIGKPAVPSLINLLKLETPDDYHVDEPILNVCSRINLIARKTLYMIEGDLVIYHLEKALKEEKDETKKKNLSEAITKFREELKAGVYNK